MFFFFKASSRISSPQVHEEEQEHDDPQEQHRTMSTDASRHDKCSSTTTSLTVWRKSLVISCKGFTVINSQGDLVFRVDNYIGRPEELVLMDASGKSILTMHRRKKFGLVESWLVYDGEIGQDKSDKSLEKKPIWCVKKNIINNILLQGNGGHNILAYVYGEMQERRRSHEASYVILGSYNSRSCKVLDNATKVVSEIKRKEAVIGGVSFGVEVFVLVVHSGFDPCFAMALVLLLDQMFS